MLPRKLRQTGASQFVTGTSARLPGKEVQVRPKNKPTRWVWWGLRVVKVTLAWRLIFHNEIEPLLQLAPDRETLTQHTSEL